jgi:hypothetical protein
VHDFIQNTFAKFRAHSGARRLLLHRKKFYLH